MRALKSKRRKQKSRVRGRCDNRIKVRDTQCCCLFRWKKASLSRGRWATYRSWKTKQNKNPKKIDFTPVASRKEGNPADTLILGQWEPGWTSNLQTEDNVGF